MRYAKTLLVVSTLAWAVMPAPAQAQEEVDPATIRKEVESADTLQSEPESVSAGVDLSAAPPAKQSASGVEYRSGGVGKEERDALHLAAAKYPLKIVLSAGAEAAFLNDATVRATCSSGTASFEADGVGPLVFVDLPPGSYSVAVTARGSTTQQSVSLGADKQTAISFAW
jgi:hypothetical protein